MNGQGYQPKGPNLDSEQAPQGGSGVPPKIEENDLELEARKLQEAGLEDLRRRVRFSVSPPDWYAGTIGIPLRYRGKRLIDLDGKYREKILAALKATNAGHNVLIFGGIGSGKTHLAVCLLWERWKGLVTIGPDIWNEPSLLNNPEKDIRFKSTSDLVADLKAAKTTWKREDEHIDLVVRPSTLLLDDLGFEERSENVRSWLSTLLDRRYRAMKQTIITTNLTPKDLADVVDDRITSRIIESGLVVHMDGPDFRRKIAEANKKNIYQAEEK